MILSQCSSLSSSFAWIVLTYVYQTKASSKLMLDKDVFSLRCVFIKTVISSANLWWPHFSAETKSENSQCIINSKLFQIFSNQLFIFFSFISQMQKSLSAFALCTSLVLGNGLVYACFTYSLDYYMLDIFKSIRNICIYICCATLQDLVIFTSDLAFSKTLKNQYF